MKTWKNLIIPAVIFVLLIAALFAYQYFHKSDSQTDVTAVASDASEQYLINQEPVAVKDVLVSDKDGNTFEVKSNGLDSTSGLVNFVYSSSTEDTSGAAISSSKLNFYVDVVASVVATSTVVEKNADLKEYGLDKPSHTIVYTLESGETHTLKLGNITYDDRFVYCMFDDTGVVYTTYKIIREKCELKLIDFLDTAVTSLDSVDVTQVTFYRKDDQMTFVADAAEVVGMNTKAKELGWVFSSPFHITASTNFTHLVESVFDLNVTDFVEQDAKDLSKYGLDDPSYIFTFKMKDGTTKEIRLSRDLGGIYYGIYSDSPNVFSLMTSAISGLQTSSLEMIKAYTCYEFIKDIVKVDAVFPEGKFVMDIDVPDGIKMTDASSKLLLDGKAARVVDSTQRMYYANLFEAVSCIEITGIDLTAKPQNTKDISITLSRRDGTSVTVDLAVKDKNTYYAFINGTYEGFLVDKEELYKDNGAKLYDYGTWAAYQRTIEAMNGEKDGVYDIAAS